MQASGIDYLRERAGNLLDVQERLFTYLRRDRCPASVAPNTVTVSQVLVAADLLPLAAAMCLEAHSN